MPEIVLEKLVKHYGNVEVLHGIDLEMTENEFTVLVGPSGCGKSTTLRMIAGLESVSAGEIYVAGKPVSHLDPKDRGLAMVFQDYALYPHMNVARNISFALRLQKRPKAEIDAKVREVAEIVGLSEFLHRKPGALSGGQRQRVAMARALAKDSDIFLFDEPLSNLDAKLRGQMRAELALMRQRLQTNAGGNLSVRLDDQDAILIKPSGVGFNECTRDNLQVVHLDGTIEPGSYKPSKDLGFHLDLYRIRDDIRAIVHCHSPWATGYASAGLEIPCLTIQTIEKIGRMPLIPLSPEGGPQTEQDISPVFEDRSVVAAVLANHGTIGVGSTLMKAQYLAEIIEETAHIAFVRDALMAACGRKEAPMPKFGTAAEAKGKNQPS